MTCLRAVAAQKTYARLTIRHLDPHSSHLQRSLYQVTLDELVVQGRSELSRRAFNNDAGSLKGVDLRVGVTLSTTDNGTSVTHSPARWGRNTGNEADYGLVGRVVLLEKVCGVLLGGTTNLSNHNDTVGLLILKEDFQAVDEVGSRERVSANTDDERLAKAGLGSLVHGLVGEGSGAGDDADTTALVDEARHNANLALSLQAVLDHVCYLSRHE
jgi:hypothetical protein